MHGNNRNNFDETFLDNTVNVFISINRNVY